MKVDVVYTEEWRRKATVEIDEGALRDWLGERPLDGGERQPWAGEITQEHLRAWLHETWDDPGQHWHSHVPPGPDDEFLYLDVGSAVPTKEA